MHFLYGISRISSLQQKFSKIILILGFGLILFLLQIILLTPGEQGYVYSIFGVYPVYFWIIFFTVIAMAICLIITGNYNPCYSVYGVVMLALCYIIFLCFPYIQGYTWFADYSYDLFNHLSWVQIINTTGNLPPIFYPATHILLSMPQPIWYFFPFWNRVYINIFFIPIHFIHVFAEQDIGKKIWQVNLCIGSKCSFIIFLFAFYINTFLFCIVPSTLYWYIFFKNSTTLISQ